MTITVTIAAFELATEAGSAIVPDTTVVLSASKQVWIAYDHMLNRLLRFSAALAETEEPVLPPTADWIRKFITDATSVVSSEDLRVTEPIDGGAIQDDTLSGDSFGEGSIHGLKIALASIPSSRLAVGSVTTSRLADYGVTEDKLATDSVTSAKIAAGAVGWTQLATAVARIYAAQPNPKYVEGTTPQIVWAPYLLAGTASYVRADMGCLATGDTATLKLYRRSNGALVTTLDVTGALAVDQETAVSIPADGVYEFRGYCDNANGTAVFDGIELEVRP